MVPDPKLAQLTELGVVKAGIGLFQNEYHRYDVYTHTLKCVDYLVKMGAHKNLIAAAYLHDIGKPRLAVPLMKNGEQILDEFGHVLHEFKEGHEKLGREMVLLLPEEIFDSLDLNQLMIAEIVGCHNLPMSYFKKLKYINSREDLREFYERLNVSLDSAPAPREDIVDMSIADGLAKGNAEPHLPILKALYAFLRYRKENFEQLFRFWQAYDRHIKENTIQSIKNPVTIQYEEG
jgi:hypothetical protein